MRLNPGLSSYAVNPTNAGDSLKDLLDFAKRRVPPAFWADTEIRLMATAGLRLVDVVVQDKILDSCRRVLRVSGFRFADDWATVITGMFRTFCNLLMIYLGYNVDEEEFCLYAES